MRAYLALAAGLLCVGAGFATEQFQHYLREQKQGIAAQREAQKGHSALSAQEFANWKAQRDKEYRAFKDEIQRRWGEFRTPGNKVWVEYSRDRSTLVEVDFEKGNVTISALVGPGESGDQADTLLSGALKRALSSHGSSEFLPVASESAPVLAQAVLSGMIGEPIVDNESCEIFVRKQVAQAMTVAQGERTVVQCTFALVPDHLKRRMRRIEPLVRQGCAKTGVDPALVMAIIQVESAANPLARSSAGAIGLMQLVPSSGGREAYAKLYGHDAIPGEEQLFDPEVNIALGCAYLGILRDRYFGGVVNLTARRHCIISAYNTGPSNVASVFAVSRRVAAAVQAINALNNEQTVYSRLIERLPYGETRQYLREVTGALPLYAQ